MCIVFVCKFTASDPCATASLLPAVRLVCVCVIEAVFISVRNCSSLLSDLLKTCVLLFVFPGTSSLLIASCDGDFVFSLGMEKKRKR